MLRAAPPEAKAALRALLQENIPVPTKTKAYRWLQRRCLITDAGLGRIPLFCDWLQETLDDMD